MPSSIPSGEVRPRSRLRPLQLYLAEKAIELPAVLLAVDMSLGKTGAALTAIRRLLDEFVIRKALVIAPLRVAENTWPEEIEAWEHTRLLSYSVVTGDEAKRRKALRKSADIYIINRENIRWLWKQMRDGKDWEFDLVVYDESSRLKGGRKRTAGSKKNPQARNLSEFGALAKARPFIKRVIELTGTPSPGGLQDLWGQAYFLDRGERLGRSRTAFERRWFESDYMGYTLTPREYAEREIMERMSDVMFSARAEDYLSLPPIVSNIVKTYLPSRVMQEYRRFERTLVSDLYDVEAVSRGVLTNKLLQFANGSMYREAEGKREIVLVHELKLDALGSIVAEAAGEPMLVAYGFRFDLDAIRKKYPRAVVFEDEPDFVKLWNKGKIGMGLAHPASIGHGLNLQFGGHIAVWYGLTWSLELYQQFNMRLPRPGQKHHSVFLHHIVAAGTADEDVLAALARKGATQDSVVDAVRVRLDNIQTKS